MDEAWDEKSIFKNEEPRLPGALSPLLIFARAEISCGGGKPRNIKLNQKSKTSSHKN
jgi:hypothetical protein